MTDIQAIKKAAEALQAARYEFSRAETRSQAAATAYAKELNARYEFRQIIDRYFSVPSTVLELCRLAEIGQWYEDGMKELHYTGSHE